ncbi:MAG: hypothetical protein R2821_07625 [Flavobacteriaceae bacterium]|jgi:hypothetical protein
MKLRILLIACTLLLSFTSLSFSQTKSNSKNSISFITGFNRGIGINGSFSIHNIAEGLPGNLRFGVGYTWLDPGNASDVRRIFINNNTGGVPEKNGHNSDIRVDYMMPYKFFNFKDSYLIFGPRYSVFKGNFNYIGSNEDFEITSKQWGLGLGAENYFKMTKNLDLVLATGLDYFFNSALSGHDTTFNPNDDNIRVQQTDNNGDPYTYKDANKAVKQPQLMPRIMVGVTYRL